ncbi:hypothetical protein [Rhodanobacter geophilus]|uniref:Uncharacterized protein n=1 Tax=Rhodanobacter geophilus TaxID=3162488 RepID=A0ABV3QRH3_9GAMM
MCKDTTKQLATHKANKQNATVDMHAYKAREAEQGWLYRDYFTMVLANNLMFRGSINSFHSLQWCASSPCSKSNDETKRLNRGDYASGQRI